MKHQRKVAVAIGCLAVVMIALWSGFSGPNTNLLDVANLTDEQILEIADLLDTEEPELLRRVRDKLVDLGRRSIPALRDYARRGPRQAGYALVLCGEIQPAAAYEMAEGLLAHENRDVRSITVHGIQRLGRDQRVTELWVRALSDDDANIRKDAVTHLEFTPQAHRSLAIQGLQQLRNDPAEEVRQRAARILKQFTGRDHSAQFNLSHHPPASADVEIRATHVGERRHTKVSQFDLRMLG